MEPFIPDPGDPLTSEHEAVTRWLENAIEGRRILQEAAPEQRRRLLLAALVQVRHWGAEVEKHRFDPKTGERRINLHMHPDSQVVCALHRHTEESIGQLLRRAMPLEEADIVDLLTWCL